MFWRLKILLPIFREVLETGVCIFQGQILSRLLSHDLKYACVCVLIAMILDIIAMTNV